MYAMKTLADLLKVDPHWAAPSYSKRKDLKVGQMVRLWFTVGRGDHMHQELIYIKITSKRIASYVGKVTHSGYNVRIPARTTVRFTPKHVCHVFPFSG